MQLVFKDKAALHGAYMPVFSVEGIFMPTTSEYKLDQDIYLLLSLPDDALRYSIAGKVGSITPANAQGNRNQSVGVGFSDGDKSRALISCIEQVLGPTPSIKPTQTI